MLLARVAEIQPNSPLLSPLQTRIENQKQERTIDQHMTGRGCVHNRTATCRLPFATWMRDLSVDPKEPASLAGQGRYPTRVRQLEAERQAQGKAEQEHVRQVELEQQQKRKEALEREGAKAAEHKEKLARARETEGQG